VTRPTVLLVGKGATSSKLRAQLKQRGHRVRVAPDCGAALETLRDERPGVVVLDVAHAGFAAPSFRDMVRGELPGVPLLDLPLVDGPDGSAGDLALVVAQVEQAVERELAAEDAAVLAEGAAARVLDDEAADAPITGYQFEDLTSSTPKMLELFDLIPRIARTDSPVLVHGETGTGKELVASAIHRQSRRREGPFFTVNCGALTESLLESELFGHEKGAFTGAYRRKEGCFELSHRGTLFLDELGAISPAMQVKLLRVLERMEVRRVGGADLVKVDVRIVAATNARLEDAVAAGTFREDLYYRVNVVQLTVPPLRERVDDVPILADIFCRKVAEKQGRAIAGFDRGALRLLTDYPWPGNVRELQNVVERAVILAAGPRIGERDLPDRLRRAVPKKATVPSFDADDTLDAVLSRLNTSVEREYLRRVLKRYAGHLGKTAEHAGLNRRTLYNKMQAYGLRREDFRG